MEGSQFPRPRMQEIGKSAESEQEREDVQFARTIAARCVCRSIARCKGAAFDTNRLINTHGFSEFPPEVRAWDRSVGPYTFYPAHVLAAFAANEPVSPPSETES